MPLPPHESQSGAAPERPRPDPPLPWCVLIVGGGDTGRQADGSRKYASLIISSLVKYASPPPCIISLNGSISISKSPLSGGWNHTGAVWSVGGWGVGGAGGELDLVGVS